MFKNTVGRYVNLVCMSVVLTAVGSSYSANSTNKNLSYLSTEKSNPITASLSTVMQKDLVEGLKLLHSVDANVWSVLQNSVNKDLPHLKDLIKDVRARKGRCFLVGAGSSGRQGIETAARYSTKELPIIGVPAGGDSIFLRAREGFEDSESAGEAALAPYNINKNDMVIVISASGFAPFIYACARSARERGAYVGYFYNSTESPTRTQELFTNFGVIPFCCDLGAQAINGSTRLQAATAARVFLACAFDENIDPQNLINNLQRTHTRMSNHFGDIAKVINIEQDALSDKDANLRKIKDETKQGYVSFLGDKIVMRDIVMDTAETAPTFSTNPPRMSHEKHKREPEFLAFLADTNDNVYAWRTLLGRDLQACDKAMALGFDITEKAFMRRPLGKGNVAIGVVWKDPKPVMNGLTHARAQGAKTVLILLSDSDVVVEHLPECDATIVLDNLSGNLVAMVILKMLLNMQSNSVMIGLNKVIGNRMVDVNPSNIKLIDRAIRLTHDVLGYYHSPIAPNYSTIESCIHEVIKRKKENTEQGIYTPSAVKIAATMLHKVIDFDLAVALLRNNEENLERICV